MINNSFRVLAVVVALAVSLLLTLYFTARPSSAQPAAEGTGATISGELKKWHPLTLDFAGPSASETDASPNNPFLDYRLQVTFTGPAGQKYNVPGFFDGDGNGGGTGDVWRTRFSPDEAGAWSYQASFRKGTDVAVDLGSTAGTATGFDGASGTFNVAERDAAASGFLKWGRLDYVGGHFLKFRDGSYWLKGGANSPENWLAYEGFDNTPRAHHAFSPHAADWQSGDPTFNASSADSGKGLIGAINYLSSQEINSMYFLPMNIGGDSVTRDTSPYVGPVNYDGSASNDNKHFDISKLGQWEKAFDHAQRKGVQLHVVLGENELPNRRELDNGTLGVERKLFYRELIARYSHNLALQWNICEEYNVGTDPYTPDTMKEFAGYVQQQDPYDHPVTVHHLRDPDLSWTPFLGDSRISITSFQFAGSYAGHGGEVEEWRQKTVSAGRPLPVSIDELQAATPANADDQRKAAIWPTYLSGGQLEFFLKAADGSSVDGNLEDYRPYEQVWTYARYARSFVEENLPFWEMEPQDGLLTGESTDPILKKGGQVFVKPGEIYAMYLPNATSTGTLDLSGASGSFEKRWYNPRTGSFEGATETVCGGGNSKLGTPPSSPSSDWVVLLLKKEGTCGGPPPGGAPEVKKAPTQNLLTGSALSSTSALPVQIAWSATDAEGPIAAYELQQSTDGGNTWTDVPLSSATATTAKPTLEAGKTYQFRVRAEDDEGNLSGWKAGPSFKVNVLQETDANVGYTGTWGTQSLTSASGGTLRYASASGHLAKLSLASGVLNVGWVAPKGSDRGKAEAWVDGVKAKDVDLYASGTQSRKVVFTKNGLVASQAHTFEARVLGTKNASSSGTRADVDAFVVLSSP